MRVHIATAAVVVLLAIFGFLQLMHVDLVELWKEIQHRGGANRTNIRITSYDDAIYENMEPLYKPRASGAGQSLHGPTDFLFSFPLPVPFRAGCLAVIPHHAVNLPVKNIPPELPLSTVMSAEMFAAPELSKYYHPLGISDSVITRKAWEW